MLCACSAEATACVVQRVHPGIQPTLPLIQDFKQSLSGLLKGLIGGGRRMGTVPPLAPLYGFNAGAIEIAVLNANP